MPQNVEYKTNKKKCHCGHHELSCIDRNIAGIKNDIVISPKQNRTIAKGKRITLLDQTISFDFDMKNPIVKIIGDHSDDHRYECDGKNWITRDTSLPHMQTTTSKVRMESGKVLSDTGLILPCALEELGEEITSLDPLAYIWDSTDNCATSIFRTEEVNLVKQRK